MPSNNIKVSVVIPTYKVEQYIERCARSLFEQTLDSIEYIFVDDCSPDNSIAVMQKVLEEYPHRKDQVKIIRHEVNQGVGAARNHGVAACSGDYIIHCDPDDWVDLNMYKAMYNKAVKTGADVVCCSYMQVFDTEKTNIIHPQIANTVAEYIENNFHLHINSLGTKLYKRKIALDNTINCPDNIWMGEDLLRNIQMLLKCENIVFVSDVFYFYNCSNQSSLTSRFLRKHFEQLLLIGAILESQLSEKQKYLLFLFKQLPLHRSVDCYYEESDKSTRDFYYNYWRSEPFSSKIKSLVAKEISFKTKILFLLACVNFKIAAFLYFYYKSHTLLR